MTKSEFENLTTRPALPVMWGGKPYTLISVDHKTKTCYLKKPGSWKKPYPAGYEHVELRVKKQK